MEKGNTFDGAKQLRKLDIVPVPPLRDLIPIKPEDVGLDDVDCKCAMTMAMGTGKCHVCKENEREENEKQSEKKQSAKKRRATPVLQLLEGPSRPALAEFQRIRFPERVDIHTCTYT